MAVDMQLPVAAVKAATNMVCYGSSLKDWMKEWGVAEIPDALELLKTEVAGVTKH